MCKWNSTSPLVYYPRWIRKLVQPLSESIWPFFRLLDIVVPEDPDIPTLVHITKMSLTIPQGHMLHYVNSSIVCNIKCWKEPRCSSMEDWIQKIWLITQWNTIELLRVRTSWVVFRKMDGNRKYHHEWVNTQPKEHVNDVLTNKWMLSKKYRSPRIQMTELKKFNLKKAHVSMHYSHLKWGRKQLWEADGGITLGECMEGKRKVEQNQVAVTEAKLRCVAEWMGICNFGRWEVGLLLECTRDLRGETLNLKEMYNSGERELEKHTPPVYRQGLKWMDGVTNTHFKFQNQNCSCFE